MKLQEHGFEDSTYERPNRRWSCGRRCEGCPCKQGPIEKPIVNIFTATCSQKENPCKPQRTVRGQRLILNLSVIIFTLAIVVYILTNQETNKAFVNPGPLTSHHSTIEGQNCQTCHDLNGHDKWLNAALSDHSSLADSKKCLSCHKFNTVSGKMDTAALNPHNMANADMLGKTASGFQKELACMNCHREHRGFNFDMKKMSNERCQSCHQNSFESLGDGHPEFVLFPYKSKNYVNFSHKTHDGYFKDNRREDLLGDKNCVKCHTDNPDAGNTIRTTTYDQVCSSCHQAHSVPVEPLPLNLLSLDSPLVKGKEPTYRTSTIQKGYIEGLSDEDTIRYLNQKNTLLGIIEGKLSSEVSKLTLTSEKDIKALAGSLSANWDDILFVHEAARQGASLDEALKWTVASTLYNLNKDLKNNSYTKNPKEIIGLLSKDPSLRNSMILVMKRNGLKVSDDDFTINLKTSSVENFIKETFKLFPDDVKKLVPYTLTLTDTDSLVVKYLQAAKKLDQKTLDELNKILKSPSTIYKYVKELDLPTGSSVYYNKLYKSMEKLVKKKPELIKKLQDNYNDLVPLFISDFLTDKYVLKDFVKVLDKKIQKKVTAKTPPAEAAALLKPYEILIQLYAAYLLDDMAAPKGVSTSLNVPEITRPVLNSPGEYAKWRKVEKENSSRLMYNAQPFHASPLMVRAYSSGMFDKVDDVKESPGKCLMCHSRISDESIDHWKTPETKKSLTKFSHVPHGSNCSSCHVFSVEKEPSLADFPNYHKDYRPMQKSDCINCHKPDGAGDSCLKCHNYHATDYADMKSEVNKLIEFFRKKP